jgi:hypothetical protein
MFMAGVLPATDDRGFAEPDARLRGKRLPGNDRRSRTPDYWKNICRTEETEYHKKDA